MAAMNKNRLQNEGASPLMLPHIRGRFSHSETASKTAFAILALAVTGCVSLSETPVKIDTATVAEIPALRAADLLNRYAMLEEAASLVKRRKEMEAGLAKQRCVFGEQSTRMLASATTLSNAGLRFSATRLTGATTVGEQDGVAVSIRPADGRNQAAGAIQSCFLGFFPAAYPEASLLRELRRLATAAAALGIRQAD